MSVCFRLFLINVKTVETIGPQERFMDAQSFKKLYPKAFNLHELFKTPEQIFQNPRTFFLFVFCSVQREDVQR